MVNPTRQKLGTRYETLLHSTQLSTVWGSTQLSAAGSGLSATRVGRICFCEWGDANPCWLNMGSLCKSDLILSNDTQKQIISSEEIDTNWDISYKTSSEEVLYLKEQQQQGPFSVEDMPVEDVPSLKLGPLPDHFEISCLDAQSLLVPRRSCYGFGNPVIHPSLLGIGQALHWGIWPDPSSFLLLLLDGIVKGKYPFHSLRLLPLGAALKDCILVCLWHWIHGRHRPTWWMFHLLPTL